VSSPSGSILEARDLFFAHFCPSNRVERHCRLTMLKSRPGGVPCLAQELEWPWEPPTSMDLQIHHGTGAAARNFFVPDFTFAVSPAAQPDRPAVTWATSARRDRSYDQNQHIGIPYLLETTPHPGGVSGQAGGLPVRAQGPAFRPIKHRTLLFPSTCSTPALTCPRS
jgi:hypothetical protein